jgi:hypothetical protein
VRLLRGEVRVMSNPGHGTDLRVRIPLIGPAVRQDPRGTPTAPDRTCSVCLQVVAAGVSAMSSHGDVLHLDCCVQGEGVATIVQTFLESRPGEQFCLTCLALQLGRERQDIEKASGALRVTGSVAVEPATCSACERPRVTASARQAGDAIRRA